MSFKAGDRVRVVRVDPTHINRQVVPSRKLIGQDGVLEKMSVVEADAVLVRLSSNGGLHLFYEPGPARTTVMP